MVWPILEKAGKKPDYWPGWPDGKKFALVLTHDVESKLGHDRCELLARKEIDAGFKSSFNFVPERYPVSKKLRQSLTDMGCEVAIHGLFHDGKLYQSKKTFLKRATRINHYVKEWDVVGFRSPAMHHKLEWLHHLDIEYDLSTFDTDPFEPQPDGVETIFPFWVSKESNNGTGYVEMPYTLSQDFTPFILLKHKDIEIWKKKLDWIASKGGMVLLNTHPDYMCFEGKPRMEEFPVEFYSDLISYIKTQYKDQYWHVLPKEMAQFWKEEIVARK